MSSGSSDLDINECWFCKTSTSDSSSSCIVNMYGNKKSNSKWYSFSKSPYDIASLDIPRCAPCRKAHKLRDVCTYAARIVFFTVGLILGLKISFGKRSDLACFAALVLIILMTAAGSSIGYLLGRSLIYKNVVSYSEIKKHPDIKTKLDAGWKIGERSPDGDL